MSNTLSRRRLLQFMLVAGSSSIAAACAPAAPRSTSPSSTSPSATDAPGATTSAPATPVAGSTTEPTVGAANPSTGATTVRVWGYGLDDTRAKARVAEFNKTNPNIAVEPVGGELNTQQLLTAVASGDPPEVINVDRSQTGSWAARNALSPIDDLIARDKFDMGQFYPFTVEQSKFEGKQYGVPQFVNLDLIFLNSNVLKEGGIDPASVDPGNWESLTTIGEKLHKMEGNTMVRTGFDTKMQDGRLWLWSWANGIDLMSPDGQTLNFTNPKVIEALTWGKTTIDKQGGEKARAAFQQAQNFFSAQNPVLIGQTAATVFEQWLIGVMKVDPKAQFAPMLPRIRNSSTPLTEATGSAFAIPRGIQTEKQDMAWNFIKGMTSAQAWLAGENATATANQTKGELFTPTITGNQQVDTQVWSSLYKSIGPGFDEAVKLFPDALKNARYRYSGPVASQVREAMTSNVNDALQGVKTPEQAMTDLQQAVQQAQAEFKP